MSQPDVDQPLVVYADYVCPFCYLGKIALDRYRAGAENPPAIEWRPFDLRGGRRGPDGELRDDVDDGKDETYFEQARANVTRLAEQYDVEMAIDIARDVDSLPAQRVAYTVHWDDGSDTFQEFHDGVFATLWEAGRDIGDLAVLVDVGESAGVGGDLIRAVIDDEATTATLREQFEAAREAGITAVPTFVYGGHAARGAIPPEQLTRLIEGV